MKGHKISTRLQRATWMADHFHLIEPYLSSTELPMKERRRIITLMKEDGMLSPSTDVTEMQFMKWVLDASGIWERRNMEKKESKGETT